MNDLSYVRNNQKILKKIAIILSNSEKSFLIDVKVIETSIVVESNSQFRH